MINPAHLNFHKDFVTMEFGNTAATDDAAASPKAEGGMFKASGNMVYGLYFGAENDDDIRTEADISFAEQNNTDFFVAGDAGVQWGARVSYHSYKNAQDTVTAGDTDDKSDLTILRVGVISGDTEGFLKFGMTNKAEDAAGDEMTGKSDMDLGITHTVGDLDYMVRYVSNEFENKTGLKNKVQNTHVGAARSYKLNDKASAWAAAWYKMDTSDSEYTVGGATGADGEVKSTSLPVVIGLEVAAKDWLTLRGSVGHNIIGTEENDAGDEKTIANSTSVAAGASLTFGDLSVDGMISNDADGNGAAQSDNTSAGNGNLRTDALMSRVSMTYKF